MSVGQCISELVCHAASPFVSQTAGQPASLSISESISQIVLASQVSFFRPNHFQANVSSNLGECKLRICNQVQIPVVQNVVRRPLLVELCYRSFASHASMRPSRPQRKRLAPSGSLSSTGAILVQRIPVVHGCDRVRCTYGHDVIVATVSTFKIAE